MIVVALLLLWPSCYLIFTDHLSLKNISLTWLVSFLFSLTILGFGYDIFLFLGLDPILQSVLFSILSAAYLRKRKVSLSWLLKELGRIGDGSFYFQLLISIFLLIYSVFFYSITEKWGDWDAYGIWNLHAKFLAAPQYFNHFFTNKIAWTHPDYPLLQPTLVAMFMQSFGSMSPIIPAVFAYIIGISLILILVFSLVRDESLLYATVALVSIVCPGVIFRYAGAQYADLLLAMFILIVFVLMNSRDEKVGFVHFFLVGFFASSGANVKNEGIAYFVIFSFVLVFHQRGKLKSLIGYIVGCIIPLLVLMYFKLFLAPVNDLVADQKGDFVNKLTDVSRYISIVKYFIEYIVKNSQIVYLLFVLAVIINSKILWSYQLITIILLMGVYFMVYVITPHDLDWHLETSFDRLFFQVLPSLLYSSLIFIERKVSLKILES